MCIRDRGATYRHFRRRHSRDGTPFLLADVYVAEDIGRLIDDDDLTSKTAMRLVWDLPGVVIADAKQVLTIERADYPTSKALSIPLDYPIARIVRIAYDEDGRALLMALGSYRSDSVRIEMRLR